MQCHCQSMGKEAGLDVSKIIYKESGGKHVSLTKDLYEQEVRWRNELVDVGPTSPLSSRYFCADYLIKQGKWICERLSD